NTNAAEAKIPVAGSARTRLAAPGSASQGRTFYLTRGPVARKSIFIHWMHKYSSGGKGLSKTGLLESEAQKEAAQRPGAPVRAAIAGATGYAGRQLIQILSHHPAAKIVRLMSSGRKGSEVFPIEKSHATLRNPRVRLVCRALNVEELTPAEMDVVFLSTPHETSHEVVPELLAHGLRVIDLSGAFRIKDSQQFARWYGFEHKAAPALAEAVYGIPELNAEAVRPARLVANPGCYATSIILALAPLLQAGWVDVNAGIIADSKSGASGAGRAPTEKLHFAEVNENLRAYGLFNHRHVPEMLQALSLDERQFIFTPHLVPITRGILSTIYVRLAAGAPKSLQQVIKLYGDFYAHAPLVRVYPQGELPEISAVAHTNYTDLGFALDEATGRLIIASALDNLGKGAAGQAVQNMNLMFGLAEDLGLA
ncbi:MAG TPA: N-acetyl-gamma-glutamyl-phosphate reductase, partial [Terriglobia bacterium]|nr:N-acetyl-gamma-glutamyl-phosphate reductase [Terriglobia bacterium]